MPRLSTQQTQYLLNARLWELQKGRGVTFSARWFTDVQGKSLQSHNRQSLQRLVDKGLMDKIIGGNRNVFYQVTDKGRSLVARQLESASQYQWDLYQSELI